MPVTPNLQVRPMTTDDAPRIVAYWTEATADDLHRMAVDRSKIPRAPDLLSELLALVDAPATSAPAAYLMWLVDGRVVGYSAIKNVEYGDWAEMHLHMWDPNLRGKGYGAILFCLSALEFQRRFQLGQIVCEPSRSNPMPNAMLRRVGFRQLGTRTGASSSLSAVTELNVYEIDVHVAKDYLRRHPMGPQGTPQEPAGLPR